VDEGYPKKNLLQMTKSNKNNKTAVHTGHCSVLLLESISFRYGEFVEKNCRILQEFVKMGSADMVDLSLLISFHSIAARICHQCYDRGVHYKCHSYIHTYIHTYIGLVVLHLR